MNDLISRQAAIDEIYMLFRESDYIHYNHGIADSLATLHKLPPAQQWIPVTERLPDVKDPNTAKPYLVSVHVEARLAGRKISGEAVQDAYFFNGKWLGVKTGEVYAWMPFPLPEPYKEVE